MLKTNKIIILLLLCISMIFTMAGCGVDASANEEDKDQTVNVPDCGTDELDYETVGEIIAFEDNGVHILTGDIAEIFKIDQDSIKDFFIGETVGVKRIDNNEFELKKYSVDDFSMRYTSMGELITSVVGTVKEINSNQLILSTDKGEIIFELYEKLEVENGTQLTIDYIVRDHSNYLLSYYLEGSKIDLVIKGISRAENTGIMVLDTEDENGLLYEVYLLGGTTLNFNHSDLKVNDSISVYPQVIRESYPAQIDAKMITK
ncbi:hypothetical protein [Vallitalea okinawensis]|uniref:hypothetical protein n=1 Tax=Vallitalea okinawensis TaxID=2078660 RepID=UPI000CFC7A67|nr:hypothetical protein [Vallitalea okinawensis]